MIKCEVSRKSNKDPSGYLPCLVSSNNHGDEVYLMIKKYTNKDGDKLCDLINLSSGRPQLIAGYTKNYHLFDGEVTLYNDGLAQIRKLT